METKFIEIRDAGTFIPALAIQISRGDGYLARRAGFGDPCIYLIHLEGQRCACDPFHWDSASRTMNLAHQWIEQHWPELKDGDVVDVEFILGLRAEPKVSEQYSAYKTKA